MGIVDTDAARTASDLVLADDHFATIVNAVEECRAVFANARKFLTYILTSNVPEIVPYLAFVRVRLPLPSQSCRSSPPFSARISSRP